MSISFEDEEDLADLEAAAAAEGVETAREPGHPGIEPFTTLILIGAAAAVGSAVIKWLSGRRRKNKRAWGQIVDLRPGIAPDDVVRRDPDLEWGQIVIIAPSEDGKSFTVKLETYDPDSDLEELSKLIFTKLSEGVFKTADEIKNIVEALLKDKGKVSVEEGAAA